MAICVIGSGPAGVSVAYALLAQGAQVLMLDAGTELEKDRADKLKLLNSQPPAEWSAQVLDLFRSDALGRKLAYGSEFPYRNSEHSIPIRQQGADCSTSLALGGLSNVWGASILPYGVCEVNDWPIKYHDLAPHFRSVLDFVPIAARQDSLRDEFPLFSDNCLPLHPSKQARGLMHDLEAYQRELEKAGIRFGYSRLAVRASSPRVIGDGCVYCGMCLHGCPKGLIFNSASSVETLKSRQGFNYLGDSLVESVSEVDEVVKIHYRSLRDGKQSNITAERVYVAGGVLGTARIILKSLNAYGRKVSFKDSQYFGVPILRWQGTKDVTRDPLHTMAQLFLRVKHPSQEIKDAHIQIYTYNDLYRDQLKKRLGFLGGMEQIFGRWLYGRMFFASGYLHSEDSSSISVSLQGDERKAELVVRGEHNPATLQTANKVVRYLTKFRLLRITPMLPMMIFGEPGKSNHVGGTFPMRKEPREYEADIYGRVTGFRRVHVVDASIFPSVPATPITLNVMANAHRIGSLLSQM